MASRRELQRTVENGDTLTFMRTYASDSWTDYKRKTTLVNPNGAGDYMPASAQNMAVSPQAETITVTIPQGSGITAIGRASIPASLSVLRLLMLRCAAFSPDQLFTCLGQPFDDGGYKRPRRPNSFAVKLDATQSNDFIGPFGGPLMLNYSNAKAGSVVTLKSKAQQNMHIMILLKRSLKRILVKQPASCKVGTSAGTLLNSLVVKFSRPMTMP